MVCEWCGTGLRWNKKQRKYSAKVGAGWKVCTVEQLGKNVILHRCVCGEVLVVLETLEGGVLEAGIVEHAER